MIAAGVESSMQRYAAGTHQHPAFTCDGSRLWHQEKIDRRRYAHLYIESWRIHTVREADDRRMSAIMAGNHHITAFACGLGLEQIRYLQHVWLDGLITQKDCEP